MTKCMANRGTCKQDAIAKAIWEDCGCDGEQASWYCAEHRDGVARKTRDGARAGCLGCGRYTKLKRMEPWTPYQDARRQFLQTNLLADKDKMVAAVTLADPAEWDIWASVMA